MLSRVLLALLAVAGDASRCVRAMSLHRPRGSRATLTRCLPAHRYPTGPKPYIGPIVLPDNTTVTREPLFDRYFTPFNVLLGLLWAAMSAVTLAFIVIKFRVTINPRAPAARLVGGRLPDMRLCERALWRNDQGHLVPPPERMGPMRLQPGMVVFRGERNTMLGRIALALIHACSISQVVVHLIILYDYYANCQLTGIDSSWCVVPAVARRGRPG